MTIFCRSYPRERKSYPWILFLIKIQLEMIFLRSDLSSSSTITEKIGGPTIMIHLLRLSQNQISVHFWRKKWRYWYRSLPIFVTIFVTIFHVFVTIFWLFFPWLNTTDWVELPCGDKSLFYTPQIKIYLHIKCRSQYFCKGNCWNSENFGTFIFIVHFDTYHF